MASFGNFTPPNYHFSEPYPIENTLAQEVGNPTRPDALGWLLAYQGDRARETQNYQGNMSALNAIQMQNMQLDRQKMQGDIFTKLLDAMKIPGVPAAIQNSPFAASYLQGIDLPTITKAEQIAQLGPLLRGAGGAQMAGIDTVPMLQGYGIPVTPGTPVPVQAQATANIGRIGANAAPTIKVPLNPNSLSPTTVTARIPPGQTPGQMLTNLGVLPDGHGGYMLPPAASGGGGGGGVTNNNTATTSQATTQPQADIAARIVSKAAAMLNSAPPADQGKLADIVQAGKLGKLTVLDEGNVYRVKTPTNQVGYQVAK